MKKIDFFYSKDCGWVLTGRQAKLSTLLNKVKMQFTSKRIHPRSNDTETLSNHFKLSTGIWIATIRKQLLIRFTSRTWAIINAIFYLANLSVKIIKYNDILFNDAFAVICNDILTLLRCVFGNFRLKLCWLSCEEVFDELLNLIYFRETFPYQCVLKRQVNNRSMQGQLNMKYGVE